MHNTHEKSVKELHRYVKHNNHVKRRKTVRVGTWNTTCAMWILYKILTDAAVRIEPMSHAGAVVASVCRDARTAILAGVREVAWVGCSNKQYRYYYDYYWIVTLIIVVVCSYSSLTPTMAIVYIRLQQVGPMYPGAHWHVNVLIPLMHEAPFRHWPLQLSITAKQWRKHRAQYQPVVILIKFEM